MQAYQQATSVFIMIGNEKYFKTFTSQFLNVSDGSRILYTCSLDEICGMAKFCNIHLIVHDFAADISIADLKDKSLFGSNNNIKVVWDYCILSNFGIDRKNWMKVILCIWTFSTNYLLFIETTVLCQLIKMMPSESLKLTEVSLSTKEDEELEHGFLENFY